MNKETIRASSKKITKEIFDLNPSAIITLFEIDFSDILFDLNLVTQSSVLSGDNTIFRFHNSIKIIDSSIFFDNKEYIAAPIFESDFEQNTTGTLPTVKLTLAVAEEGIPLLTELKQKMFAIKDLTGAKVTRIKTCLKFLDRGNFLDQITNEEIDPDPSAIISKDVFYIDRKSSESTQVLQYELASILDVVGVKLPKRLVVSDRCPWTYRCEGCLYEYASRKSEEVHGKNASLPLKAPAIANDRDELITNIIGAAIVDKGEYKPNIVYPKGSQVFVRKNKRNYYFVAKVDNPSTSPPNTREWEGDQCSKLISGCKLRFGQNGSVVPGDSLIIKGRLMYGGFLATNKLSQ